ncbi:MAG: hypothetical protein B7C24_11740 [Bacteroidetes bacterium 4572_77]|nr:MAG: hypothetical protein B7C24_11740 [Bacteroidetes bacterium 4572_77]
MDRKIFRSIAETAAFPVDSIKNLFLVNGDLEAIPDSVFLFRNLKTLNIKGNKICCLPHEIGQLLFLQEILLELKNLKEFNISRNPLTKESLLLVFQMENLENLSISKLRLKKLPPEIGNLNQLSFLSIFCNQIDSLPCSFGNLKKLEVFNAGNNPRIVVCDSFAQIKSLKRMYWVNNKWDSLPKAFEEMVWMNDIYVNGNKFSEEEKERVKSLFTKGRLKIDN